MGYYSIHASLIIFTYWIFSMSCQVLDTAIVYEIQDELDPVIDDVVINRSFGLPYQTSVMGPSPVPDDKELKVFVGVKSGLIKWPAGYQSDLVCRLGSYSQELPSIISTISFTANFGIMSFGNDQGLAVIDFIQKVCLLSCGTPDLYGSMDPHSRVPWNPSLRKEDFKSSSTDIQSTVNDKDQNAGSGQPILTNDNSFDIAPAKGIYNKNQTMSKSDLKRAKSQETGHFTRSGSSSTSSLENVSCETIRSLIFVESFARKTGYIYHDFVNICLDRDSMPKPCLWVGTSLGTIVVIHLIVPDLRTTQPVIVSLGDIIHRLKDSILCLAFLDGNGDILTNKNSGSCHLPDQRLHKSTSSSSNFSINVKESVNQTATVGNTGKRAMYITKHSTGSSSSSSIGMIGSSISVTSSQNESAIDSVNDSQFGVFCSEKNAQVISLPSQTKLYKIKITETSLVLKASVITIKSSPCLVAVLANSHLMAFSLPSLRLLMDLDMIFCDEWVEYTFCFTNHGLMLYMSSISEMEKATFSTELVNNIKNIQGDLFTQREIACAPKKGFFENLFTNTSAVDLDELFGETCSGKALNTTATLLTSNKMERLQQNSGGTQSEIAKARLAALERGEKLLETEQKTQEMMEQAKSFGKMSSHLAAKYEKKDRHWGLPF